MIKIFKEVRWITQNKISLIKWQDNRSVIVGTNFQTDSTNQTVKRWKKLKAGAARIEIPIPSIIKAYNNGMVALINLTVSSIVIEFRFHQKNGIGV